MIYESYYWKKELYDSYLIIANLRTLQRKTEISIVKVEKALMFGAYVIRKLDEAQKIPPDLLLKNESIELFKSKGTIVDHMNWHRFDRHYALGQALKEQQSWRFLINQLIHSYTFIFSFDKQDKFDGILINTDKNKNKLLYFLPIDLLLKMFLTVSEGDITTVYSEREGLRIDENGKPILGEMKLKKALYSYPFGFDIEKVIKETMQGKLYKRTEVE